MIKKGFTIIELLIAVSILVGILTITSISIFKFIEEKRSLLLQNEIISETNFLFENIIRYIRNGNIDYQSYWRENVRNHVVDNWIEEGVNPRGVNSQKSIIGGSYRFNSIKNCGIVQKESELKKEEGDIGGNGIIENYIYQFIFPGNSSDPSVGSVTYHYYNLKTKTNNPGEVIHLNCISDSVADNLETPDNERNIYDDDKSYGKGPKAFSGSDSSKWEWSWNTDSSNPILNNNPPLLLISSDGKYRTAIRYSTGSNCSNSNGSGCILIFESKIPESGSGYNKEGLGFMWECLNDYCSSNNLTGILASNIGWKDITPSNIIIKKFEFFVGPEKNPELAFNEKKYISPSYVILKISIEPTNKIMNGIRNRNKQGFSLNLQTTIIPRSLYSIKTLN